MQLSKLREKHLHWTKYGRYKPITEQTIITYEKLYKLLINIFSDCHVEELKKDCVMQIREVMMKRGNSQPYIGKAIIFLRTILKYADEELGLNVLPYRTIKIPPREKKVIKYLTYEELEIIYKHLNELHTITGLRLRAFISLILSSALRISEVLSLNRDSIKNNRVKLIGKGNKEIVGMFHDWAIASAEKYLQMRTDNHEALFVAHYDPENPVRWKLERAERYLRELGAELNIEITAHKLRKTASNFFRNGGADIRDVQKLLNHEKVSTTETFYVGVDYDRLQQIHSQKLTYGRVEKLAYV